MSIDLRSLNNVISRLEEGFARYELDIADTQIRDGLIQRFDFTYELGHKMLKRYLEFAAPSPAEYHEMPFSDMIRSANEQGLLLSDWPTWRHYREMQGKN